MIAGRLPKLDTKLRHSTADILSEFKGVDVYERNVVQRDVTCRV